MGSSETTKTIPVTEPTIVQTSLCDALVEVEQRNSGSLIVFAFAETVRTYGELEHRIQVRLAMSPEVAATIGRQLVMAAKGSPTLLVAEDREGGLPRLVS